VKALGLVLALSAGCNWTTFDGLSDTTWVHAQETPDSDQSDYAVAIVNATTDSPGELAVLSGSPANYSTLGFDASGSTNETLSQALGVHSISTLSVHPLFIGDDAGNVAIVDKGIDGPLVVIHGTAGQLTDSQLSSTDPVDAGTFVGSTIVVTSAGAMPTAGKPNAFLVGSTVVNCALVDGSNMPLAAAALTSDGTTVWAYARDGHVIGYALSDLTASCGNTQTPSTQGPSSGKVAATTAPAANGGYIALVGSFAITVAFDSPSSMTGAVSVVDLTTLKQVGASIAVPGVQAAKVATFGTMPALALGFPNRVVGTTTNVGEVELHAVDSTMGAVAGDVGELLSIPQAGANLTFGRALAALKYNGSTILVVAADNVVYAYYETTLYSDTRTQ
jgi:hypothetical protein